TTVLFKDIALYIENFEGTPYTEEENNILYRFGKVFQQTYTRFLDLQKAEAQAREAQIEAALEKVRSRSLAMHKSDELHDVIKSVLQRLDELGIAMDSANINTVSNDGNMITAWIAAKDYEYVQCFRAVWSSASKISKDLMEAYQTDTDYFAKAYDQEEKNEYLSELFAYSDFGNIPDERKAFLLSQPAYGLCAAGTKNSWIQVISYSGKTLSPHEADVLKRFARVFEQCYVRFQDLEKAESQAREAEIQLALERVRARTMAMHKSDELREVVFEMFNQMHPLGLGKWGCGVGLADEASKGFNTFFSSPSDRVLPDSYRVPIGDNTVMEKFWLAYKNQASSRIELSQNEKHEFDRWLLKETDFKRLPEAAKQGIMALPFVQFSLTGMRYGILEAIDIEPIPDEQVDVLRRFANVFEQTYTRFLDLQKAEAQAQEAQLETALERVRSRSLAMHKSTEIEDVVAVVFTQLQQLGLNFEVIGIATRVENTNDLMFWIGNDQHSYANRFLLPYTDFGAGRDILAAMDNKAPFFSKVYPFEEKNRFWRHAFENSGFKALPDSRKQYILDSASFSLSVAPVNGVLLLLIDYSGKVATEQESELVKRFARVFEQCYVRFQDLEKVEAQAREATIQASLERVRAKAMAMHSSQDLAETIHTFYSELVSMNLTPRRAGLGLINRETRVSELSTMNTTETGISVEVIGELVLKNHPVLEGVYDHWLRQEEYHPVLRGNEIKEYYQLVRKNLAFPDYPNDAVQFGYFFFFEEGGVYAWTDKQLQEDELNIYRRFTSVLSLTYKRYKDLKDAEARAREAVKQASLDRVRAEIASMRNAEDLQRITPLVWRELRTLGVPFFRCGVMIVHEKEHHVDFYLSTPEGRPLAALHLDSNGQEITKNAMEHWRQQTVYTDHWDREQFAAFAQSMVREGQIQNTSAYQGGELPPESLTLQFSPFAQGMLYVGSVEPLSGEQLELVHALADAFSTAYARYEDFTRLEAAKATVERALSELRTTQNQLVQSEKMAS
ncbi:MAG: hypothetical protein JNN04_10215, partial [Cyclobacteriaceae bacterium]|nr:hypothetical protein [Cyclobacteriaceae bacterium]